MEYLTLGHTRVQGPGSACAGFSRLGLGTGKREAEAVALVSQALDLGVNPLDTTAGIRLRRRLSGSCDRRLVGPRNGRRARLR